MQRSLGIFFFAAAACGGAVTTVDGSKSTGTLSPTDQNQLCDDTYNYILANFSQNDIAKLSCGFQGMNQPSCPQTYDTCVTTMTATEKPLPAVPDCTGFNQGVAKCNTTVDEYTKCLKEELDAVKAMEASFPLCDQATAQVAEINALQHLTADCVQLMQTCQIAFAPSTNKSGSADAGTD
jgi:hypothetical protein